MKTPTMRTRLSLGAFVAVAAVLAGCPQVPPADPLPPAPTIKSFTASETLVAPGTRVKLTWSVENATEVKIDEVKLGSVSGVAGESGEVEVAITEDSLYVLTARNGRGASDSAVVSIRTSTTVMGELLFSALPTLVGAGEDVTLAWSASGATSVTITAAPGGAVDVRGQAAFGSVVVKPQVNTTYTLTAGGRTATAMVSVRPALLSFTAASLAVDAGSPVTLSWKTASATRVQLTSPGRGTLLDETDPAKVADGTFTESLPAQVDPGQLFAYRITVTGSGVSITDELVISLQGSPAVLNLNAPTYARQSTDGGTITLSWQTRDTESVSLAAEGVEIYRSPNPTLAANGSVAVPTPANDTTYTLTARGGRGGVASASKRVDVVGPPTVTFTATPAMVAGGEAVTLTWAGTNIRSVAVSEPVLGLAYAGTGALDTGSASVRVNANSTFTLVADNSFGDVATATAQVTVTNPLTISVAETGALRRGQDVTVSWSVPGGAVPLVGLPHTAVDARPASAGFDDIATTGTLLTFPTTGNILATIDTPFRTVFFGKKVGEKITVSRYGYLVFADPREVNGANSTDEALPTAKLEPSSVAPYWESLTSGDGVFWEVKRVGGQQVLIVQWNRTTAVFQAQLFASGQINFEYAQLPTTISGKVGIKGPLPHQSIAGPTPAVGTGLTFFGPRSSPATMPALQAGPFAAHLDLDGGTLVRVEASLGQVVAPTQLTIAEALPASTAGANGAWVELRNSGDVAIDLAGWSFNLADGGAIPLSGTVPARALLVVGASTDPAANDDAGVQVAVSNFDLSGETSLVLARNGAHSTFSVAGRDAGTAMVNDPGPWLPTSTTTRCLASATYGALTPAQRGTPGADVGCGFPYALSEIPAGYYDIADGGTAVIVGTDNLDDVVSTVSLTLAPVPFFGASQTSLQVSSNGFFSFQTDAVSTTAYPSSTPSTSAPNSVVSVFGDDLQRNQNFDDSRVLVKRVGQGEDPFAAAPHWIIQWHHWSIFTSTLTSQDDLNFQAKLFDDGTIEYHYGVMSSRTSSSYATGDGASSWLESPTGSSALRINAYTSNAPGISPHTAFRFSPR